MTIIRCRHVNDMIFINDKRYDNKNIVSFIISYCVIQDYYHLSYQICVRFSYHLSFLSNDKTGCAKQLPIWRKRNLSQLNQRWNDISEKILLPQHVMPCSGGSRMRIDIQFLLKWQRITQQFNVLAKILKVVFLKEDDRCRTIGIDQVERILKHKYSYIQQKLFADNRL